MGRQLKSLAGKLKEAEAAGKDGRHEEARRLFEQIRAECSALGFESVQGHWFLAVCGDYLKEHVQAMAYIR